MVSTMDEPTYGVVETRYRAWIASLGELSPRRAAMAEQLCAVANRIDGSGNAGAVAAASRELRVMADAFLTAPAEPVVSTASATGSATVDPVDPVDEVARRRLARKGNTA